MQYLSALRYPFRGPHVWVNLGSMLVSLFIPIAGPMVISGYLVGVEKLLIRNLDADPPRFDFGKFGFYLGRGVPPFVVALLASVVLMLLLFPVGILLALSIILMKDQTQWLLVIIPLIVCVEILGILIFGAICTPLMFKAGLVGKIEAAFDITFLKGFWKRVGLLMIGTQLLAFLVVLPFSLLFICIPFVGPYAAMACFMQVQTHLNVQMYLTYLDRGGAPIPFIPDEEELHAFPVLPQSPPLSP